MGAATERGCKGGPPHGLLELIRQRSLLSARAVLYRDNGWLNSEGNVLIIKTLLLQRLFLFRGEKIMLRLYFISYFSGQPAHNSVLY